MRQGLLKESNIVFDAGTFWVAKEKNSYVVYKNLLTHAISDSEYDLNEDGLSISIARCKYLSKTLK